ncbi:uncharacterized protein [Diabrotica undecimpunctata]|uniref:uncharacterized protein isoform X2 n=1 Tax=Diabrotica undecimpunctata TaxID=50387 RepID=UPI003B63E217
MHNKKYNFEIQRLQQSSSYQKLLADKRIYEERQALEEARLREQKEREWLKVEEEAQKQFQELQKKLALAREERAKQNEAIKLEWEEEQKRRVEQKRRQEEQVQKQIDEQQRLNALVEDFLEEGGDTPKHLKTTSETNPNKQPCPFFQKTSTCRFFDVCSRNHVRPGISKILLIPNFFSHYSLEKTESDHFTDSSLEFESHETNACYREFFHDVVPELEKYGKIQLFITCCNREAHLRGNVFVEFASTRSALKSYRALNGRWYGGKQLSVQFANIPSWKSAVCGVHFINSCPKGSNCNFIHAFRNPGHTYGALKKIKTEQRTNQRSHSEARNWRWSESPEHEPKKNDWDTDSNTSFSRKDRQSTRNGFRKRRRSRSRSKEKNRRHSSSRHRKRDSSSRSSTRKSKYRS